MELCFLGLVFYVMNVLPVCVCTSDACSAYGGQKTALDPLEQGYGLLTATKLLFCMSLKVKSPQKSLKEAKHATAQQGETVTSIPSWIEPVGHLRGD